MMISIIMPILNEAENLKRILPQLKQIKSSLPYELIIVDGGSQDGSQEIAGKYGTVYHFQEKNRGAQLRYGVSQAKGEILWFLHADSWFEEDLTNLFEKMVSILKQPNVSAGFFRITFKGKGWFYRYLGFSSHLRALHLGLIFGDQGMFISREIYHQVGGFEAIPLMEDFDLSRKLAKIGKFVPLGLRIFSSDRRFEGQKFRVHVKMHWYQWQYLHGKTPEELVKKYYKE
ncbi:TIGR04283 family arsenosugar biosynthesis glycosyltransferase [Enterococcus alishanensis]|nr:TIGR04283 family arsenosugar biosynthesis glycosyltransferase [Enterococcus alishanensis]